MSLLFLEDVEKCKVEEKEGGSYCEGALRATSLGLSRFWPLSSDFVRSREQRLALSSGKACQALACWLSPFSPVSASPAPNHECSVNARPSPGDWVSFRFGALLSRDPGS